MIGERVSSAVFGALTANHGVTCYIWGALNPCSSASGTGVNDGPVSTRSAAMVYIEGRLDGWMCCFTHYILHLQTLFRFPTPYLHASRHSRCAEKSLAFVIAQSLSYASLSGSLHCRFLLLFKSVQVAILRRASISTRNRQLNI